MVSKLLRRSGTAVTAIAGLYGWEPDVVFQGGVGVYHEEIEVMQEIWPAARFIGCEPNPMTYPSLVGKYPGALFNVALGAIEARTTLRFSRLHRDGATLGDGHQGQTRSAEVDMAPLDVLLARHGPFGERMLLWLDCEGSELGALQGGRRFMQSVEFVNVEVTANPNQTGWCTPKQVHNILHEYGFARTWTHTFRNSACQMDCIYIRRDMLQSRYCACPCELPDEV